MSRRGRITKELLVEPGMEANIAGRDPAWTGGPEFEELPGKQLSQTAKGLLDRGVKEQRVGVARPQQPLGLRQRYGIALLAIIAVTTIGLLERIFGTVELSFSQWSICIGIAASLVAVEELIKLVVRQRDRRRAAPATRLSVSEA